MSRNKVCSYHRVGADNTFPRERDSCRPCKVGINYDLAKKEPLLQYKEPRRTRLREKSRKSKRALSRTFFAFFGLTEHPIELSRKISEGRKDRFRGYLSRFWVSRKTPPILLLAPYLAHSTRHSRTCCMTQLRVPIQPFGPVVCRLHGDLDLAGSRKVRGRKKKSCLHR